MDLQEQIYTTPSDVYLNGNQEFYTVWQFEIVDALEAISDARDRKDIGPRSNPIFYESIVYEVPTVNPDWIPWVNSHEAEVTVTELAFYLNGKGLHRENYQPKYETKLSVTD
jgi:hypothetical protein